MSSLGEIHSVSPFIVGGKNSTRDIAVRSGGCAGAGEREDARGTPPFRSLDTNKSAPHAHRHKRRSRFHSHFSLKGRYRGQTGRHYPPRSRTHFTSRGLGPLSVGGVPSLSTGGGCYFSVHSAYNLLYYHLKEGVSRRREGFSKIFPTPRRGAGKRVIGNRPGDRPGGRPAPPAGRRGPRPPPDRRGTPPTGCGRPP